jgi:ligand-binding sensor domain-containing protein
MGFDGLIFWLAVAGFIRNQRERWWILAWAVMGLIFLLLWPTKWPQYTMVIIPAICLSAAYTAKWLYHLAVEYESYYGTFSELIPRPPRSVWIMIGAIGLVLFAAFISNSISVARMRIGWSQFTTSNSFIPGSTVYALVPGSDGQMVLGTDRGLVYWSPPAASDLPDTWVIYNTRNSGLLSDRVLSLAGDPSGVLWLGTQAGVVKYEGSDWSVFRSPDMGLSGEQVNAISLGSDERVWVGTSTGAAVYDGKTWQSFTTANSGIGSDAVFTLAVEPLPSGDRVWFGTLDGLSRYDTALSEWFFYPRTDFDMPRGGVADLLVDSEGRLWMASLGGGLFFWDGMDWQSYRTSSSEIPLNTVRTLTESDAGVIWVGLSIPNSTGGLIASYNGMNWTIYNPRTSGFSGAEPICMAFDSSGRLWIGTRTAGVDIYQFAR